MSESSPDPKQVLHPRDVDAAALDDWRVLFRTLHARFETGDFVTGVKLVEALAEAAEEMNHHPDVDLTYPRVAVRLSSHDVGGVTSRDVELARRISAIAADLGATARPDQVAVLELGLDTHDRDEIAPFWAAPARLRRRRQRLGDHRPRRPHARHLVPAQRRTGEPPRQRWHLDVRVPPEIAEARIRRALDAGGTLVTDEFAPAFWVLADPQGNQACVTTWHGRD